MMNIMLLIDDQSNALIDSLDRQAFTGGFQVLYIWADESGHRREKRCDDHVNVLADIYRHIFTFENGADNTFEASSPTSGSERPRAS